MVETGLKSRWADLGIETKIIKTRGDERHGDFGLVNVRASCEGLFTGEIERALVAKAIDLAAHFGFVNFIARFPFGCHDIDCPLHVNVHGNLGAFAACAGDFQFAAHLRDPLAHAGETHTVMLIVIIKANPIVMKLQTKLVCVAD